MIMKQLNTFFPDDIFEAIQRLSAKLQLSPGELIQCIIKDYLEKDQADFKPVGFGMWANRNELKNSSEWVRELRESEWQR